MVVLPDPTSDKWPFFGHVYLRQDSLDSISSSRHRHRPRDETLRLWNYYLPLKHQKDQFKFVLFLQRLITMVEENYRHRHRHRHNHKWKVSAPIEDWYHQSIRDLSKLGVDENLMSGEWRKVVQRGNREEAKRERREAEKVHLERNERERERRYVRRGYHEGETGRRKRKECRGYECSEDDTYIKQPAPQKDKSSASKEKDFPKGTPKWVICSRNANHCPRTHEMVKCNGRCGLTSCSDKAHRCHKIYIDYECSNPECTKCQTAKEKQEERERKVANPKFEEKWVDCPCEDPWCRRKVLEIKEIEMPKQKLFVTKV
ncbi:cec3bd3e-92bb-4738-b6f3-d37e6fce3a7a [Sclerotinia trifoliorum]|uniref:Cec3bd3e-92bb-4738-b6f3-d37e6fce3a7a n=1 Tax=Sclerotinia trifoliorum TaxID=28548 RepID=A0A8H2VMM5_9HELO|nr:cec3bd3e-92bb-4738-b6f3-d37e6fce3a7a [Sclerotinia trifoliorum]